MIAEPVTKDYTIPQGADYPIRMRYTINGVPVDLTGASISGTLKKSASAEADVLTFTLANGRAFLNVATGVFGLDFRAADTLAIEATKYVYNIKVVLANGDTTRAMQGSIVLTPEVS